MIRELCFACCLFFVVNLSHAQDGVNELAEACVTALESCEAKVIDHQEQVERYESFKQVCQEELKLRNNAHQLAKEAVDACKETVEIREKQINKLNKIEANLNKHSLQCMDGYSQAMKDYKNCVETSSFSLSNRKVFWIGLVLGLLVGVPIAL